MHLQDIVILAQFMVLNANAGATEGGHVSWPGMDASWGCPRATYRKQSPVVEYLFLISGSGHDINIIVTPYFPWNSFVLLALSLLLGKLFPTL